MITNTSNNQDSQTFDNALIIEFLAQQQPDLIKQWHSHVGINALKQLAEEFNPPEPEPVKHEPTLIDERLVFEFMDYLIFNTQEFTFDPTDTDSQHGTAEFWQKHPKEIFAHLTEQYEAVKDYYSTNVCIGAYEELTNKSYYPQRLLMIDDCEVAK